MIRIRDLLYQYPQSRARLQCALLEIGVGLTLVVGRNGAGKSTFLRLIAGVERPDRGEIQIGPWDLWRDEVRARSCLAYVPEQPDVSPYATVAEALSLVRRLRGAPAAALEDALRRANLLELRDRSIREMSMGQRRRVMLASAWIGNPELLLLDEPLETMDRSMQAEVVAWVRSAAAGGRCVLLSTHDLEPFSPFAERVLAIADGGVRLLESLPLDPTERASLLDGVARG